MEEKESSASSTIFNISLAKFKDLIDLKVSLDELYVLDLLNRNINPRSIKSTKVEAIIQGLQRKGYLLDNGEVTVSGQALVTKDDLTSTKEIITVTNRRVDSDFETWWREYPTTDIFEYKGRQFTGTRGLRVKKEECRVKFNKIIAEGEYTIEDLVRALRYEIHIKKETSFKEGENKMKYMQMSVTYLNQRTFENFVEISKQPLVQRGTGTDI